MSLAVMLRVSSKPRALGRPLSFVGSREYVPSLSRTPVASAARGSSSPALGGQRGPGLIGWGRCGVMPINVRRAWDGTHAWVVGLAARHGRRRWLAWIWA